MHSGESVNKSILVVVDGLHDDAAYELPVAWTVTKASTVDITEAPTLVAQLPVEASPRTASSAVFDGGPGVDDTKLVLS